MTAKSQRQIDAIVIGSGAGGGAAAWRLAARGVQVLLLEEGPAFDPAEDYTLHRNDWEQSHFPEKIATRYRQSVAPLQYLEERWDDLRSWNHVRGRLVKQSRRYFGRYNHVVGLGGSTLHYTGEAHRMLAAAMRMKSRFDVAADWPMNYADLEPYYGLAESIIGVAGPAHDPNRERSAAPPLAAHGQSFASKILGMGAKHLGLSWQPNHLAALSEPFDGRLGCNYCGNCTRGCPRRDKGSVDVTYIPKAMATGNCEILTQTKVLRLVAGGNDRITAVVYKDSAGDEHSVSAPHVVVACGAVETPRLLLASANRHAPDGIANESGLVGKNFMETLSWYSAGLHPDRLGSHRGLPSDSICWDFNAPDAIANVIGGCRFTPYMAEADLIGPINYAQRIVGGWGKQHQREMRDNFGRVLAVGSIGEHLPNARSYIDLDPKVVDEDGVPRARIHSYLTDTDLGRLSFMAKTCRDILDAAGVSELREEVGTYDVFHATHVFGTCRMGIDQTQSVVDADGRSHRWGNLYITDASTFPSSGGGEAPSLTIQALAIRSIDRLLNKRD